MVHHPSQAGGLPPPPPPDLFPPHYFFESRLCEMNKRLTHRTDDPDQVAAWWDAFANEFFDDEAQITLRFLGDDGNKQQFSISRTLIPRYYRWANRSTF